MEIADLMTKPMPNSSQSLLDMGFEYLILDDGWAATSRDENGDIIPGMSLCNIVLFPVVFLLDNFCPLDPIKFPNGMKYLSDYVRGKGLKLGLYTTPGNQ